MKYRLYKKDKKDKMLQRVQKTEEFYEKHHVDGIPWLRCCPVVTWDNKYAVPKALDINMGSDEDDGLVDSIEPPIVEE